MYRKPSAPRSTSEVLDDIFQLYKAALPSCWLPALLLSLGSEALSYFVEAALPPTPKTLELDQVWSLLTRYLAVLEGFDVWYLVLGAFTVLIYSMLIVNILAVSCGEKPALRDALVKGARRAPALLGASIFFILALSVSFSLLIVPGFYVWNRLQLYPVAAVGGSLGPSESLSMSWRVTAGHWWHTATVVGIIFSILLVLDVVLGTVTGSVAFFSGGGLGASADPVQMLGRPSLTTTLFDAMVHMCTTPLIFACFVATYQDLQLRARRS